jgi:hypothetical protein
MRAESTADRLELQPESPEEATTLLAIWRTGRRHRWTATHVSRAAVVLEPEPRRFAGEPAWWQRALVAGRTSGPDWAAGLGLLGLGAGLAHRLPLDGPGPPLGAALWVCAVAVLVWTWAAWSGLTPAASTRRLVRWAWWAGAGLTALGGGAVLLAVGLWLAAVLGALAGRVTP